MGCVGNHGVVTGGTIIETRKIILHDSSVLSKPLGFADVILHEMGHAINDLKGKANAEFNS